MHIRNCKGKKMYLIKENDVKIEYLIGFICHSAKIIMCKQVMSLELEASKFSYPKTPTSQNRE